MSDTDDKDPAAVALGRKGGSRNSEAQQRARQQNARLGGRPRLDGSPAAPGVRAPRPAIRTTAQQIAVRQARIRELLAAVRTLRAEVRTLRHDARLALSRTGDPT